MIGELCALGAALTWSISILLFKKSEAVSPLGMNLFKNTVALGLLGLTMLALGLEFDLERSARDWGMLALSGVLGIALADTLTFMALRTLGPGLLAVVDCAYAPSLVLLSVLLLGESLSLTFAIGGLLVVLGVFVAVLERSGRQWARADARARRRGVFLGVVGIVTMGLGVMAAKPILEGASLIEVTTVRLAAGIVGQLAWMALVARDREALRVFRHPEVLRTLVPASLLGSYVSMILWLGGFKWTSASTAAVLNQVSTVFTIILARVFLAEPVTLRRAVGVTLAMGGALLVLLGSGRAG